MREIAYLDEAFFLYTLIKRDVDCILINSHKMLSTILPRNSSNSNAPFPHIGRPKVITV